MSRSEVFGERFLVPKEDFGDLPVVDSDVRGRSVVYLNLDGFFTKSECSCNIA
jgi:hypothetical protein